MKIYFWKYVVNFLSNPDVYYIDAPKSLQTIIKNLNFLPKNSVIKLYYEDELYFLTYWW